MSNLLFDSIYRNREKEMEEHESQQHEHNHGEHNATTVNTSEAKIVARTFRYMRRKPTIIAYKPPEGKYTKNIYLNNV